MSDRKSEIIKELESYIEEVKGLHGTKIAAANALVNSTYKEQRELEEPFRIIRTVQELEALELDDADAIVLASEAGAVRTARALAAMHRLGSVWGLPAVVVATGDQVRAAREAMEKEHG